MAVLGTNPCHTPNWHSGLHARGVSRKGEERLRSHLIAAARATPIEYNDASIAVVTVISCKEEIALAGDKTRAMIEILASDDHLQVTSHITRRK